MESLTDNELLTTVMAEAFTGINPAKAFALASNYATIFEDSAWTESDEPMPGPPPPAGLSFTPDDSDPETAHVRLRLPTAAMDALNLTIGTILGDEDMIESGRRAQRSPDAPPWLMHIEETEATSALLLEGPESGTEHIAVEVETVSGPFLVVATITQTKSRRILTHVELQESSMHDRLLDIFDGNSPACSSATALSGFQTRYRLESAFRRTVVRQDDTSLTRGLLPLLKWILRLMP